MGGITDVGELAFWIAAALVLWAASYILPKYVTGYFAAIAVVELTFVGLFGAVIYRNPPLYILFWMASAGVVIGLFKAREREIVRRLITGLGLFGVVCVILGFALN
jgi:hypothetical protein